ncbi:hypothetical protein NIES2119_02685 [[Phormidium ambiguum] IAM M-71]|uniref:Uncharacterized protein n=1 Tax=[Phormidium ambiguum] IAM M-71 TaxID=454136 RepID=A0A1U7ISY4_9CYAN|nr:hypothetical protein [Phormidium ambiguum]OKH40535.1 hypothetical protein NIES2119_02685 [Phormidium ambiguum IAM M-71]
MDTVTATFLIPDAINQGLKNGNYVRFGGVIRDAQTKQVVAMLREVAPNLTQAASILSQVGSVASILNLGVSVIGFAIVIKRLGEIEQRLKQVQEDVKQLHYKFDLSVYANFRAALDLARDAFTMSKTENRMNMAYLAINRFLEAQHTYTDYVNRALEKDIQVADEYLSSLFLTYVARARCYLELEEVERAFNCLKEGADNLRISLEKYVKSLLISEPVAISYPSLVMGIPDKLESPIKLYRLAEICRYLDPTLDNKLDEKTTLFKAQSKNLVKFIKNQPSQNHIGEVIEAIGIGGFLAVSTFRALIKFQDYISQAGVIDEYSDTTDKKNLLKRVLKIEAMIETYRRFKAYKSEVEAIAKLGINFHDWIKLTPPEIKPDEAELMYIIPSKPLDLIIS